MKAADIEARLERIERLVIIAGKEVLNTREAALVLGITEQRVRHLTSAREIPYYKKGRDNYYKKSELERWRLGMRIASNSDIQSEATTYCVLNRMK